MARQVEEYIRIKNYSAAEDVLDHWGRKLPTDKLDGYLTLLRVRVLLGRSRYVAAAEAAEVLVGANSRSHYSAQLLALASEAYRRAGLADHAEKALRRVVEEYPDSPLAEKAAGELLRR